jgi:hypothetical protein
MFADYQEFAAAFARRCRERRNAEEEQQQELAELTKPATVPSAAAVCKSNGAGAGIIHKVHDNAHVADNAGASMERTLPARTNSKQSWWEWVDERIEQHLEPLNEVIGQAMAEYVGKKVDPIKRELELTRRELDVLRMEINVKALQEEVRTARAEIPSLAAVEARFDVRQADVEGKQARLERELTKTKERVSKMRVDQSIADYSISQLEKAASASKATAVVMELETSTARFALRGIHPDAAKALREFASQVVDAEDGGAIWGRCFEATAGTA